MNADTISTSTTLENSNSTPDFTEDVSVPEIDVDQFSDMMKSALLNSQFDVATKLLADYDYNVYFTDDDQKTLVIDTTPELMAKIMQFCYDNMCSFNVHDFTVFQLLSEHKAYAKLSYLFQSGHLQNSDPDQYIIHAISLDDSTAVKLISRYVDNFDAVMKVLYAVEEKVYEKDKKESKDKKDKKVKYVEFKNTPTLLEFLTCEFIRPFLDVDAMKIVINMATQIKDNSLYSFIIRHSLFSSTSTRAEDYNLVFCYIDRACLPLDANPDMIQYLLESNIETSVIRGGLLSHITTGYAEMPSFIYDLFLKDSRNILFDMINVPDQIQTSILNSLFFSNSSGYTYYGIGYDDFKKIEMTSDAFLKRFTKKSRCVFMLRVFEAYMRGDHTFSHLKDLLLGYYYSKSFELFSKAVNSYYKHQMSIFPDRVEPCDYKIFELFDVDAIERLIPFATHFHALMTQFPPEFTSSQIVFLHSKCNGKSKNSKEFIQTLKNITGKDYTFAELIDFESIFKYEDGRQIFNSIVMDYVGLENVAVNPRNRIE